MKKSIKTILAGLLAVPVLAFGAGVVTPLVPAVGAACGAVTEGVQGGVGCGDTGTTPGSLFDSGGIFTTIVNILLFLIGAIAVIMLIIGGVRYTISGGDSGNVTAAKNTILYAIIGLIVAILAYAIVNFVLTSLVP